MEVRKPIDVRELDPSVRRPLQKGMGLRADGGDELEVRIAFRSASNNARSIARSADDVPTMELYLEVARRTEVAWRGGKLELGLRDPQA